ncbi:MAG: exodeoxyribonuclease VII small subunit, partial [Saprospiraceae bacterium]
MSKKVKLTYDSAMDELKEIVSNLQEELVGMDELSGKMKRAGELIRFCREKLRATEQELEGFL